MWFLRAARGGFWKERAFAGGMLDQAKGRYRQIGEELVEIDKIQSAVMFWEGHLGVESHTQKSQTRC